MLTNKKCQDIIQPLLFWPSGGITPDPLIEMQSSLGWTEDREEEALFDWHEFELTWIDINRQSDLWEIYTLHFPVKNHQQFSEHSISCHSLSSSTSGSPTLILGHTGLKIGFSCCPSVDIQRYFSVWHRGLWFTAQDATVWGSVLRLHRYSSTNCGWCGMAFEESLNFMPNTWFVTAWSMFWHENEICGEYSTVGTAWPLRFIYK